MEMKENPRVSLIVPVYNTARFIKKCMTSLLAQTWNNIEYVIVDDGTPDNSIEIVNELIDNEFPSRREDVKIVRKKNAGLGMARITGLQHAKGNYILFIDSDDWTETNMVEVMVRKAIATGADLVYCDVAVEKATETLIRHEEAMETNDPMDFLKMMHTSLVHAYMWNKLMLRSRIDVGNLFVPSKAMHEDMVFMTQIAPRMRSFANVDMPLYHYRKDNEMSITRGRWADKRMQSAENHFDLFEYLFANHQFMILDRVGGDILMRAAWYALSAGSFSFVNERRLEVDMLSRSTYDPTNCKHAIKQILVILYCRARAFWTHHLRVSVKLS